MTVPWHEHAILTKVRCPEGELRTVVHEGRYGTVLERLSSMHNSEVENHRVAFPDRGKRPFSVTGKDLVAAVSESRLTARYEGTLDIPRIESGRAG